MRGLLLVALSFAACAAQLSVAPLFPLSGAAPDLGLILFAALSWRLGVASLLPAVPAYAAFFALLAGRSPLLSFVAYAGAASAFLLAARPVPGSRRPAERVGGAAALAALALAGLWSRATFAVGSILAGASAGPWTLLSELLLPGALLDLAFYFFLVLLPGLVGWLLRGIARRGSRTYAV